MTERERIIEDSCIRILETSSDLIMRRMAEELLRLLRERELLLGVLTAASALIDQPMLVKGNAATWGDVAQSEAEAPKLLAALIRAVQRVREPTKATP